MTVSYRPTIKVDANNTKQDLPLDAETVKGHPIESIGIVSNTTTLPTTAQVKTYVDNTTQLMMKVPVISSSPASTITIDPYKIYNFGTLNQSMSISLSSVGLTQGYAVEYTFRFVAGANAAITLPNTCKYNGGEPPVYIAGRIYEYNIVDDLVVIGEFY